MRRDGACNTCGHPRIVHLSNIVTNRQPIDSPVPCFAVVNIDTHEVCGCTAAVEVAEQMTL